jgi:hypothetical protein
MSFAPITEEFDCQFARTLPPAAKTLWTWLRRMAPVGREVEFSLKEFASSFDYSLKWGRKALNALIEVGLVKEIRRYHGYGFRVQVYQVGELTGKKTSSNRNESSPHRNETSQKPPSNPHSLVSSVLKDLSKPASIEEKQENALAEELTGKPAQPPEQVSRLVAPEPMSQETQQLIDQAAQVIAPEAMNPQIRQRLQKGDVRVAERAVELVRYRKQFGNSKIESLAGLLMQALANKWHLRDTERQRLNQQEAEEGAAR